MDKDIRQYNPVKDYLNSALEVYPDDHELETVISLSLKQVAHENNKGYRFERTAHNPREMAFYEQWMKENEPRSGVNSGNGILQDLFFESTLSDPFSHKRLLEINNRDRMIVATIIQWLGSNVGMCFLEEALNRFGAHIAYKK